MAPAAPASAARGRVLGLDLGAARIGVAVSDSSGVLASPYAVLTRAGEHAADHAKIAELVDDVGAVRVVVGLPLSLAGGEGPAARAALAEVDELAARLKVPVITVDERLTTVEARRRRVEQRAADRGEARPGRSGGRRREAPKRRRAIDDAAAALLLQAHLDAGRPQ